MCRSIFQRLADSTLDQIRKTARRPSRLFFIVLRYFFRGLAQFPKLTPGLAFLIPRGTGGDALCREIGYALFQADRPVEAWCYLKRCIEVSRPSTDDYLLAAMCLYHGLGRFREASALFREANELAEAELGRLGLGNTPYRVLDNVWARHIGHTATIDYVLKLGILEGRDARDTIWYVPRDSKVANRFLLEQVAAHLRLVEDPADLPFCELAVQPLHFDYLGPRLRNGVTAYFWKLASDTYRRWQSEGRGALFTLPDDVKDSGWAALHRAGLPAGGWFVGLHVREGTYDGRRAGLHGVHNAEMATYLPAIAEITRRGGWVIRMGDPGMSRLPTLPNVIDYCHSDLRADWMDIFIATQGRFMLGSASGPVFIPPIYGVPSVITNWWPPAHRPLHPFDIFIPKMMRKLSDGSCLSLSESLHEPYSYCHSRHYLSEHGGVYVEDADAELIRGAVVEMFGRLDGALPDNPDVSDLRARADRIYHSHDVFGMSALAADFILRHRDFIA